MTGWLLSLCISTTGCSNEGDLIDSATGMPTMFCPELKERIEEANGNLWTLGQSTTLPDFKDSLFQVIEQTQTISTVSESPAKDWLEEVSTNAVDFVKYFSGPGEDGASQLMDIASRWKGAYEQLDVYCK